MRFNEGSGLDASQVEDLRGSRRVGGRGVALGGGGLGLVGTIVVLLITQLGGGGGSGLSGFDFSQLQPGQQQQVPSEQLGEDCRTGADANRTQDCRTVAVINSIQGYWQGTLGPRYEKAVTNFFSGGVDTGGCGSAASASGPFYCPADSEVYIDLSFYDELRSRFGARGGPFSEAYVLAHEYGHHVQNLDGTSGRVGRETGPESGTVRLELQADCYAGVWANHATSVPDASGQPLIIDLTQEDIDATLDTAGRIGDDYIQSELGGGRVDESSFTHGSSEQRRRWFDAGYRTGDPNACDTFAARDLG